MAAEQRGQHIILCGLDELGLRILEQLRRLGEDVVVIARAPGEEFATEARTLGAQLLDGAYRDESVLRAARVPDASALVLAEDDDVENLHAALTAQELNPRLRIVLRMFNRELGLRVQTLFRDCSVFSSSAIAAPAFVAAALHEDWEQRFEVAGRVLVVRQGDARDPSVLLPLARVDAFGETALFPAGGEGLLCLADAGPSQGVPGGEGGRPRSRSHRPRLRGWRVSTWTVLLADRRLRVLAALLLALMVVSVAVFSRYAGLDPVSAVYFTVTVITTTGFGDINLRDASPALKMYGTALMLLGTAALTILYALITDAIVSARLARAEGPARDLHDHIVVCGLGNVGYRVVEAIDR